MLWWVVLWNCFFSSMDILSTGLKFFNGNDPPFDKGFKSLFNLIMAPGTEQLFGGGPNDVAKDKLRKVA